MDLSNQVAIEVIDMIEKHYPEFLIESGLTDSKIVRAGYYMAVLQASKEDPIPEAPIQEIVSSKLQIKIDATLNETVLEFLPDF